jgi:hypothetical protein
MKEKRRREERHVMGKGGHLVLTALANERATMPCSYVSQKACFPCFFIHAKQGDWQESHDFHARTNLVSNTFHVLPHLVNLPYASRLLFRASGVWEVGYSLLPR